MISLWLPQGKADLSIVNVIADEECDPDCTAPMLSHDNLNAVLLYFGNAYVGRNGGITWTGGSWSGVRHFLPSWSLVYPLSEGKPVVGGRFALWDGFNTPESLSRALR